MTLVYSRLSHKNHGNMDGRILPRMAHPVAISGSLYFESIIERCYGGGVGEV